MSDIKATVEELERDIAELPGHTTRLFQVGPHINYREAERAGRNIVEAEHRVRAALPSLLAELRRCWAIEEAAVRYRDKFDGSCKGYCSVMDELSTRDALFAALPPRKPSGGEEAR